MTLYDRVAATPDGSRTLAQARLRRETLRCLHRAQAGSGLSVEQIATRTGERRRAVRRDFDGDGNIPVATLARYLHAMGYEAELTIVPAGEPRRKVLTEAADGLASRADDDPAEPNARIRAVAEQMRREREQQSGYTIGVYLPPEATAEDIEALTTAVADAAYNHTVRWDPDVVGLPGDPLGTVDGQPRP